jgi:hypothetical protein
LSGCNLYERKLSFKKGFKQINMKKIILTLSGLCIVFSVFAQSRETRNLGSFNEVSVSEAIKVELVKGSSEKAEIEVSGTDAENVLTEVSGDRLKIHMASGNWKNVTAFVRLTYKNLEEIDVSSAASVSTESTISSERMEMDVSSAAKADLIFDVGQMELDVSSAANFKAEGEVDEIEVDVSSAGSMSAYELECKAAELSVSSAGSIKITVTERIDARASSGGSIRYKGKPEKERISSSSGGSVKGNDW